MRCPPVVGLAAAQLGWSSSNLATLRQPTLLLTLTLATVDGRSHQVPVELTRDELGELISTLEQLNRVRGRAERKAGLKCERLTPTAGCWRCPRSRSGTVGAQGLGLYGHCESFLADCTIVGRCSDLFLKFIVWSANANGTADRSSLLVPWPHRQRSSSVHTRPPHAANMARGIGWTYVLERRNRLVRRWTNNEQGKLCRGQTCTRSRLG